MVDTVIPPNRTTRLNMAGTDTLVVQANGLFSVGSNAQTVRFTGVTDGATIDNAGIIENTNSGGRAIRFETGVGATLNATITNSGTLRSIDDTIQIQAGVVTSGRVTVDNEAGGSILSTSGQSVDFAGGTGTFVTEVNNSGSIFSDLNDGVRVGGIGEIRNTGGTIDGGHTAANTASADGIQFEDDTTGDVINSDGGIISGDRHGVNAGEGSVIYVSNAPSSTIIGRNGSGVGSDGSATVVNYGTISGGFTAGVDINTPEGSIEDDDVTPDGISDGDGDGVDIDGFAVIENYGIIEGTGAGGNGSDGFANTSEGIAAGGGSIFNYAGGVISGAGLGILIDDSSQGNAPFETLIVNDGTISAGTSFAIRIVSDLDDLIENNGTITGGTSGNAIQFGSGDNTLILGTSSSITGLTDGGAGSDTLDFADFVDGVSVDFSAGTAEGTGGIVNFENVIGGNFSDEFKSSVVDNFFDGAGASDTVIFSGALADYEISKIDGGYTVSSDVDGTDTLLSIETLTFADGTFAIADAAQAVNDEPTNIRLSRTTLAEDTKIWTTLALFGANDAEGDDLTYTLLDDAGGMFAVRGRRLITSDTFDYETATSHDIRVAVSDGINVVEQTFTIGVTDVLEPPVNTAPTNLKLRTSTLSENATVGTSVGLLSATDAEGQSLTWKLLDNADSFKLLGNKLVTSAAIDYEATPELTITVQVTDSAGLSSVEDFTIAVRDVFEGGLLI